MPAPRLPIAALARSCHPAPTAAVTVMGTVLAIAAGNRPGTVVLAFAAVLAGQLSIGWGNDLIDADRDRAAGRRDKPVAAGRVDRRALVAALTVSSIAVVPLSLALGWRAGAAHLIGVAFGWLYDLGLKATVLSPVAYAVAFGLLPSVATLARDDAALPPWWVTAAGALLGVGAHLGNVLPDIDDDRRAGVRGAPQRIGLRGSAVLAALAVVAAAGLLLVAGGPRAVLVVLAALVVLLAGSVVAVGWTGRGVRRAFGATMLAAAVCVAMLVLSGGLAP